MEPHHFPVNGELHPLAILVHCSFSGMGKLLGRATGCLQTLLSTDPGNAALKSQKRHQAGLKKIVITVSNLQCYSRLPCGSVGCMEVQGKELGQDPYSNFPSPWEVQVTGTQGGGWSSSGSRPSDVGAGVNHFPLENLRPVWNRMGRLGFTVPLLHPPHPCSQN